MTTNLQHTPDKAQRINTHGLQVAEVLYRLVEDDILPGSGVSSDQFWSGFANIVNDLVPENRALLKKRDQLQAAIDEWHMGNQGQKLDLAAYKQFLTDIGYLVAEPAGFEITTKNVDEEIAAQPGPQLVVPVKNARFALNAANARWGSLYDALYGTDAIPGQPSGQGFDPERGRKVIARGRALLDETAPLARGSHAEVIKYHCENGALMADLKNGEQSALQQPEKFAGFTGAASSPASILLKNNGLHLDIQVDSNSFIGKTDPAGVKDILVEAAITTIMDCEDSVAAVDAEDKTEVYRNWLGLMKGDLQASFAKSGQNAGAKTGAGSPLPYPQWRCSYPAWSQFATGA